MTDPQTWDGLYEAYQELKAVAESLAEELRKQRTHIDVHDRACCRELEQDATKALAAFEELAEKLR